MTDNGRSTSPRPLVALGILSAAPYKDRRAVIRRTWLSGDFSETTSGLVVARFVVAVMLYLQNGAEMVIAEQSHHHDLIILPSNYSGRTWSPLLSTFRWFSMATTEMPYREAAFVAKLDDDVMTQG